LRRMYVAPFTYDHAWPVTNTSIGRRLKIKCDLPKLKGSPCSSCEKRGESGLVIVDGCRMNNTIVSAGCGELCPDNALKTGKGTRYILSGTEGRHCITLAKGI
jgi:flavoprotein